MSEWNLIETAHTDGRKMIFYYPIYDFKYAICWFNIELKEWECWRSVIFPVGATHWKSLEEPDHA